MAISKLLHMKDCKGSFKGKHLKASLEYIMNPEKTQDGRLVGSINCRPDTAFSEMMATKRKFEKTDKRQGYHFILSFKEDEADPDTAFQVTKRFVEEYLGKEYEAVYVVHDNTEHVHSHIVFNSVSYLTGKKYRYEKGDWARDIQPLTNRLCKEYGLSILELEEGSEKKERRMEKKEPYREWNEYRDGRFVWSTMIRRDVDACILQAGDFEGFLELLSDKGYEIKQNKYLAVRPPGMKPFRRLRTLGEDYTEERIRERILSESMEGIKNGAGEKEPKIIRCHVRRYRRAGLSGLQKAYYARLYRIGKLKKKPYSMAWKYKDEIRRMETLQKEYLFLASHDIKNTPELTAAVSSLTDKRKEAAAEKSRAFRKRAGYRDVFGLYDSCMELAPCERAYRQGDEYFREEHEKWETLTGELKKMGYTVEEAGRLKEYFAAKIKEAKAKENAVRMELRTAEAIFTSLGTEEKGVLTKENRDRTPQTESKQPKERLRK